MSIYMVYKISLWSFKLDDDSTLRNALFVVVNLTKIADKDKYKYSGHEIEFYYHGTFSLSNGSEFGKNVIIFGADLSSYMHVYNRKKEILISISISNN